VDALAASDARDAATLHHHLMPTHGRVELGQLQQNCDQLIDSHAVSIASCTAAGVGAGRRSTTVTVVFEVWWVWVASQIPRSEWYW
jgi:hypothetical protein